MAGNLFWRESLVNPGGSSGDVPIAVVDGPTQGPTYGPGVGDWDTPTNWSLGVVPDSTNQAIFDSTASGQNASGQAWVGSPLGCNCVSFPDVDQLEIQNGYSNTVTFNNGIALENGGNLSLGTIDQPNAGADISIKAGTFQIYSGTVNSTTAPATVNIAANAYLILSSTLCSAGITIGDTINNAGSIYDECLTSTEFTNDAGITNQRSGQIFLIQGDLFSGGTGQLNNSGVVQKTTDSVVSIFDSLPINNISSSSSLWIQSGTLYVLDTSSLANASVFQAAGTVKLGVQDPVNGDQGATLVPFSGFTMTNGSLSTYGSGQNMIFGNVLVDGGYISIRASEPMAIGSLSIWGDFKMDGGSYYCTIDATASMSDQIIVQGSAVIGGTAMVLPTVINAPAALAPTFYVKELTTSGGVAGQFASAGLDWVMSNTVDKKDLVLWYIPGGGK